MRLKDLPISRRLQGLPIQQGMWANCSGLTWQSLEYCLCVSFNSLSPEPLRRAATVSLGGSFTYRPSQPAVSCLHTSRRSFLIPSQSSPPSYYLWKVSRLSNPPPANRRQDVSSREIAGQRAASLLPQPQPSFFLSFILSLPSEKAEKDHTVGRLDLCS